MSRVLALGLTVLLVACRGSSTNPPSVQVRYSPWLDTACSWVRGGRIENGWAAELTRRVPEVERLWASAGPPMMAAAQSISGRAFPYSSVTARLTLCDLPSQSILGVSVNMRFALSSFTKTPVSLRYKVDTLFHELLHGFVSAYLPTPSPLLAQHRGERPRVLSHLHVLALQKAVLVSTGALPELADVVAVDGQLPDGAYRRAWQIVNASDKTYLDFVRELRE